MEEKEEGEKYPRLRALVSLSIQTKLVENKTLSPNDRVYTMCLGFQDDGQEKLTPNFPSGIGTRVKVVCLGAQPKKCLGDDLWNRA